MKLLFIIFLTLKMSHAGTFQGGGGGMAVDTSMNRLGANEKFDFRTGFSPAGTGLDKVCYINDETLKAKIKKEKCERVWIVDSDSRGSVFPHEYELTDKQWRAQGSHGRFGAYYTPSCKTLKTTEIIKSIPMKRKACLKWENYFNEDGDRRSRCAKRGYKKLPRAQRLDTYLDFGSFSERQNSGSAMFTIPRCREEFH
ncbi:MAG: hypothetical protein KC478_16970 [Bacteriovoracaceae bacterium]|nr:hypothetical protein [Bacteriovoracaceae bacterium]